MSARRHLSLVAVAVAVLVAVPATGCSGGPHVELSVTPSASLADAAARVQVSGLSPGAQATLALDADDAAGRSWHSAVVLTADGAGLVDTSTAAAAPGGSYSGVFADGLIAMLRPTDGAAPASFAFPTTGGSTFRYGVTVDGREVATAQQERHLADPDVAATTFRVADHGFDGVFAHPTDTSTRRPAVLLIGGSEGGNSEILNARLLAAHGIPALAVAYFNAPSRPTEFPDLPKNLRDIPLEYFRTALRWLAAQPGVDADQVRVEGASRGSEAALLAGIEFPDLVHGVAALVPTNAPRSALVADHGTSRADPQHSPWTYQGREIPWTTQAGVDPVDRPAALFAVERIKAPILFVCGAQDQLWASCAFSQAMTSRLDRAGFRFPHQLLSYPDGGHFVSLPANFPYVPDPHGLPGYGSTDQANPLASADAWPKTINFLQGT